jgi:PTH1 family peptidyl-tRNA hydrolase
MKVLIGLGNPGKKYTNNLHNIVFSVIDKIANKYSRADWVRKFEGKLCECWSDKIKFLLLKPETFMNNSGQSVAAITTFYKLSLKDLIVFHDDLDLKVGQIKIKHEGGHAGHNGIRSIHQAVGDCYTRIRIGIGHPGNKTKVSSYVLSDFTKSENIQMEVLIENCLEEINELLCNNNTSFLKSLNDKNIPTLQNSGHKFKIDKKAGSSSQTRSKLPPANTSFSFLDRILRKLN